MKSKLGHGLMAYICMPLIFGIIGYGILLLAMPKDVFFVMDALSLFISDTRSSDTQVEIGNIFQAGKHETTEISEIEVKNEEDDEEEVYQYIDKKQILRPNYGEMYGLLQCEKIALDAGVYWGDSKEVLKNGVGQYIGSFLPGYGRTILISGHNTTFFSTLGKLEVGDSIVFQTNYELYKYEVYDIRVINEGEAEALMGEYLAKQEENLIFYTCYPFEKMTVRKTQRYFVFAKRVEGLSVEDENSLQKRVALSEQGTEDKGNEVR